MYCALLLLITTSTNSLRAPGLERSWEIPTTHTVQIVDSELSTVGSFTARDDEPLLAAAERAGVAVSVVGTAGGVHAEGRARRKNSASLNIYRPASIAPSDCRRGNCLTCSARAHPTVDGEAAPLQVRAPPICGPRDTDTALCDEGKSQGLVLMCSSFVTGDGLRLELELHDTALQVQYGERITKDSAVRALGEKYSAALRARARR